jgi:hypothetical protein
MSYTGRESATEAASRTPTDWAALGARILAAASQAAAIHMVEAARLNAQNRRPVDSFGRKTLRDRSAEPKE